MNKHYLYDSAKTAIISFHCVLGTASVWAVAEPILKILAIIFNFAVALFTTLWLKKKLKNAGLEKRERELSIEIKKQELKKQELKQI